MADVGSWSEPEVRGRVEVVSFHAGAGANGILVSLLRPEGYGSVEDVVAEYARDLTQRVSDGWTLIAMTMYPIGHRAGSGYPGMNLDKAMIVATYERTAPADAP